MGEETAGAEQATPRGPVLGRRGRLVLGGALLLGVLLVASYRLDWRAVVAAVGRADLALLVLGALAAVAGLACWSEAMRHLLPPGSRAVSRRRGFLVYATGSLVRNALPVGYASSLAVLAYVFRREASITLDRSLAAVSVAEFLNAVASSGVAIVGILLLATVGPATPYVGWLALGAVLVSVGAALAATLLWYRRETVERVVHSVASKLATVVDRLADRERGPLSPDAVEAAIAGYYRSLSTVSDRRRAVTVSLSYSVLAWAALVTSLYACGLAIGYRVPIPVAMLVVPIGGYATVLPLPGGLGGYEFGVASALAILGGMDVVAAVAVTLLFRLCSFWLVIGLGAVAATALSVDIRDLASAAVDGETGSAEP